MEELLQHLRDARRNAAAGAMDQARQHVDKALQLLEANRGPGPHVKVSMWTIRGYISEARFAITKPDSRRASKKAGTAYRLKMGLQPGVTPNAA